MADSKARRTRSWVLLLFVAVFGAAGLLLAWVMVLRPFADWVAARSWEETTCEITSARVQVAYDDDGDSFTPVIAYRYEVGGRVGNGSAIDFSPSGHGYDDRSDAERWIAEHDVGSRHPCWADPETADRAVLDRGLGGWLLWALAPLPFLGVAIGALIALVNGGRMRQVEAPSVAPGLPVGGGPLELEREGSPWLTAFLLGGFALIWETFSLMAFGQAGDACSQVFIGLFVLIGAGVGLAVPYQVGRALNPKLELVISPPALAPGVAFDLLWRMEGRSSRVRRLVIKLVGKETATYKRGTNTSTVEHVFHEQVLADVSGAEVASGMAAGELPANTVPSFKSTNNAISWALLVQGDIAWWPDIDDRYEITVGPGIDGGEG
ncbi:MAG: DUF3592 domain-containing protein [Alphaproteobacteria bacterium]|nr:DUF3592 domain-containing protein [Alphaproteobacteria bacterium]